MYNIQGMTSFPQAESCATTSPLEIYKINCSTFLNLSFGKGKKNDKNKNKNKGNVFANEHAIYSHSISAIFSCLEKSVFLVFVCFWKYVIYNIYYFFPL